MLARIWLLAYTNVALLHTYPTDVWGALKGTQLLDLREKGCHCLSLSGIPTHHHLQRETEGHSAGSEDASRKCYFFEKAGINNIITIFEWTFLSGWVSF